MELVLDVVGVDQFPKRDVTAGWAAGCRPVMEPVEAVLVGVLVTPAKTDGAAVVLLVTPNMVDVLLAAPVEAGLVVERDGACPNPAPEAASPKMGLKVWTAGLVSGADVAEVVEVVVVPAKMGLSPEVSRGLVLLASVELLAGAVTAAVMGLEAGEAAAVPIWVDRPNRLAAAVVAAGATLGALET